MTDQTKPGTSPDADSQGGSAALPDSTTPTIEPVEAGASAPAQPVARDPDTGPPPATRRSSGLRWAIALVGVAVIVGATAIIVALASGRPSPSVAVGYMPADTISYAEYRLDLPGDQRAKMAAFLGKFPGFDDPSQAQAKLYEIFDRIILAASKDKQSYTANVEPWFGGQIAMGNGPIAAPGQSSTGASVFGSGEALFVVTVKDKAKATDWLKSTSGESLTETAYNGTTIYRVGGGAAEGGFAITVTDKVMLLGTESAVRAAFDSNGAGKLAEDAEFKAAFGTVSRDYVSFTYVEARGLLQSIVSMEAAGSGLDKTTVDDELLSMVPTWQASSLRFEDDALVGDGAYPRIDIGFDAKNKKSSLVGHAPPGTIFYTETHDVGSALKPLLERLRNMPDLRDAFKQIDSAVGVAGGFDGLFGWWGDAAVAISKGSDGSIGGGLLIQPTDATAAKRTFDTLRSFLLLAGGSSGIELRDVDHAGATITVIDFSAAAAASSGSFPAGVKAELAYTVTNDVVVIGYGEAFVASVLDAGPGPSLADDSRFMALVKRAGQDNIGLSFVDVRAIRDLVEPLVKAAVPADKWAYYEKEIRPYILPFDAVASGARVDGDLDRVTQFVTVKESGN